MARAPCVDNGAPSAWFVVYPTLLLLSWAIYSRNVEGEFTFDDQFAILGNADTRPGAGWGLWTNDFWGQYINKVDSHKSYRPIVILSFRLSRYLWTTGDDETLPAQSSPFHVENILLHFLCVLAVYHLAHHISVRFGPTPWVVVDETDLGGKAGAVGAGAGAGAGAGDGGGAGAAAGSGGGEGGAGGGSAFLRARRRVAYARARAVRPAFIAAAAFAVHPVNTEAVNSVVGRSDLMGLSLSIGCFLLYTRIPWQRTARGGLKNGVMNGIRGISGGVGGGADGWRGRATSFGSVLAVFMVAMLCKETCMMVLPIILGTWLEHTRCSFIRWV